MSKKPAKKISEKEKARRQAASKAANDASHAENKKLQGKDHHFGVAAPRIMRHQGR